MKQILTSTFNVVLTSAVHLLCCWLPIVAAVSGRFSFDWLVFYKSPLIALQIGLLVWGFYDMYWRGAHSHSTFQKAMLWFAVLLTAVLNLLPHSVFQPESSKIAATRFEFIRSTRIASFELKQPISEKELRHKLSEIEGIIDSQTKIEGDLLTVRYKIEQTNETKISSVLGSQFASKLKGSTKIYTEAD